MSKAKSDDQAPDKTGQLQAGAIVEKNGSTLKGRNDLSLLAWSAWIFRSIAYFYINNAIKINLH